ncbi:hypothetical protein ACSSS7_008299 [Eimeria intestinalis]
MLLHCTTIRMAAAEAVAATAGAAAEVLWNKKAAVMRQVAAKGERRAGGKQQREGLLREGPFPPAARQPNGTCRSPRLVRVIDAKVQSSPRMLNAWLAPAAAAAAAAAAVVAARPPRAFDVCFYRTSVYSIMSEAAPAAAAAATAAAARAEAAIGNIAQAAAEAAAAAAKAAAAAAAKREMEKRGAASSGGGLKREAPVETPAVSSSSSSSSSSSGSSGQKVAGVAGAAAGGGGAAAATAAFTDALGEEAAAETRKNGPLVLLVTGMAGSGKSTLVKAMDEVRVLGFRMVTNTHAIGKNNNEIQFALGKATSDAPRHLRSLGKKTYVINLDPAVVSLVFEANVDIRDTVDYKRVMQHYKLGPNGGILTALNLFATKFGALLLLLQQRSRGTSSTTTTTSSSSSSSRSSSSGSSGGLDYVLVDTPGQIEVFTWSASGALITEALAATFPTCIIYTVDACRSQAPNTLLSNMVHACSVLYRHKLPFLAALNKIDAQENPKCVEWIRDYDLFQEALLEDDRYMGSLGRSTALALCSFYENIDILPLSAITKQGFEELPVHLEKLRREYKDSFLPYLMEQRSAAQQRKLRQQQEQLKRFAADSSSNSNNNSSSSSGSGSKNRSSKSGRAASGNPAAAAAASPSPKRDAAS